MEYYAGIDVSLKESSVCVVDTTGKNDTEFACKGNLCALHPATPGHIKRPALQTGKARRTRQHDMGGLE